MFASTLDKVADLCYQLADSITPQDIAEIGSKDRMQILGRLQFVYGASQKVRRPTHAFRRIDTARASIGELEEEMLRIATGEVAISVAEISDTKATVRNARIG